MTRTRLAPVQKLRPRRLGAFTLIEIMVVIAIIVILAGISIAVGVGVKQRSAIKATKAQLASLKGLMDAYLKDAPAFPVAAPPLDSTTNPFSDTTLWVRAVRSASTKDAGQLERMTKDSTGTLILDTFGTPVRYVPRGVIEPSTVAVQEGYFWSFGPDRATGGAASNDDIRSTEAN